jgi:hypothetical protein
MSNYTGQNITTLDLARELKRLLDKRKTTLSIDTETATIYNNEDGTSATVRINLKPGRESRISFR